METPGLLARLRRDRLWVLVGLGIAIVAAASRFAAIGLLPPSIKVKALAHSTASTQLVVGGKSSLTHAYPDLYDRNLVPRAAILADMIASPQVRGYVARAAHVPASEIAVDAPVWIQLQRIQQWATGEKRATEIVDEKDPYRITLNDSLYAPVIGVVTQAPTASAAARLARGVADGLSAYVSHIGMAAGTPGAGRYDAIPVAPITVDPSRPAGLVNVAAFTFAAVFVLWCGLVLVVSSVARDFRAAATTSKVRGSFGRSSGSGASRSEATGGLTSPR